MLHILYIHVTNVFSQEMFTYKFAFYGSQSNLKFDMFVIVINNSSDLSLEMIYQLIKRNTCNINQCNYILINS